MKKYIAVFILLFSIESRAQYFEPIGNGIGMNDFVFSMCNDTVNNILDIFGPFTSADDTFYNGSCYWNGNNYSQLGALGSNGIHYNSVLWNGYTIVNKDISVRMFNGTQSVPSIFTPVIPGFSDIHSLLNFNGDLYIGGGFYLVSDGTLGIGKWNGVDWETVGGGLTGMNSFHIEALGIYNGELIAGGRFDEIGVSATNIARWDGSQWHPMGNGILSSGIIRITDILEFNGKLYVTGNFDQAGGASSGFVIWNGTNWSIPSNNPLVLGFDLEIYHNNLYISGQISNFGGPPWFWAQVSRLDGDSLIKFPTNYLSGFTDFNMCAYDDYLYLGGRFLYLSDSIPANKIGRFHDGSFSWFSPIGSKWWYNSSNNGTAPQNSEYLYYECVSDTFIKLNNCRKISATSHHYNGSTSPLAALYVYGDSIKVKYWNNWKQDYIDLYRFNVSNGDTLTYYTPQPQTASDTTFRVVVDSITQLNIQGINYKRVWSTPLDNWSFGNDGYTQLVGGLGSMLPQPINLFATETPLRCYQDTSVFFHYMVSMDCDDIYCPTSTFSLTEKICAGETYNFNGTPLTTSGVYTSVIPNMWSCDSTITVTLDVTQLDASITSDSTGILTATGTGTVQWYNCTTGTMVAGETDSTYSPTDNDLYAAVFSFDGCSDTSACLNITGINDLQIADYRLQIYPNPANETVTITAENIKEVIVSNLLGVQMMRLPRIEYNARNDNFKEITIDISKLPQGIYLLRVQTTDGWRVGKVVKE